MLGVAQPILSRQIRRLEDEIGTPLLYRNGRGVAPTEAGEKFLVVAASLLDELARVRQELVTDKDVPRGPVSLGMPPSMSAVLGARLMTSMRRCWPDVHLRITEAFSGHVNEWLLSGRIDLAILHEAQHAGSIATEFLLTEDLFLFGAPGSAADPAKAGRETITFAELAKLPLILPGQHHGLRRQLDRTAAEMRVELGVEVEVDALGTLKELAATGVGFAILPFGSCHRDVAAGTLCARSIVEPAVANVMVLAMSRHRPVTPAMREVLRVIRTELAVLIASGSVVGQLKVPAPASAVPA